MNLTTMLVYSVTLARGAQDAYGALKEQAGWRRFRFACLHDPDRSHRTALRATARSQNRFSLAISHSDDNAETSRSAIPSPSEVYSVAAAGHRQA